MEPATTITPPEGPQQDQIPDGLTRPPSWLWLLPFFAVMLSGFVPVVRPWDGNDLDWAVLLQRFYLHGSQFGVDVAFTYGPWGFIWAAYDPHTFPASCICWISLALIAMIVLQRIFNSVAATKSVRSLGMLLAAVTLGGNYTLAPDVRLMMLPLLLLLYHFLIQPARSDVPKLLLSGALGLVGLVKFTYLVGALLVLGAITLDLLLDRATRRRPVALSAFAPVGIFALVTAGMWLAAGQNPGNFRAWLSASSQMAAGYSETMGIRSVHESSQLTRTLLALSAIFATGCAAAFARLPRRRAIRFSMVFAPFLVLVFRAGFVRHDFHELITNGILLALAPPLCWIVWFGVPSTRLRRGLCVATAATTLCAAAYSFQFAGLSMPRQFARTAVFDVADEAYEVIRLTGGRPLRQRLLWEEKWKQFAGRSDFPKFLGTVEEFPDFSPELLATASTHIPRPTLKSVAAYTPFLSQMNARTLCMPDAINNLLMRVAIFEQRMPTMDDNRSWPAALQGYDLLQETGRSLHLIRRAQDRKLEYLPLLNRAARLNESIAIPAVPPRAAGKTLLWGKIDFHRQAFGQFLAGFYRAPAIFINIKTIGGSRHVFRIVPLNASDGFILGPVIERNETLRSILTTSGNQADLEPLMPASISVEGRYGGDPSWYFGDTFQITIEQMILE